jgi:hypothetical protein
VEIKAEFEEEAEGDVCAEVGFRFELTYKSRQVTLTTLYLLLSIF